VSVAELMGHKNLKMLTEIYQHVGKRTDHLRKAMDQATAHLKRKEEDERKDGDEDRLPQQIDE
jgi:hypothetical protein